LDVLSRPSHIARVAIEPVDKIRCSGSKGGGQPAVAAAQVNDQPAFDPGSLQNPLRLNISL
jgi:hypothetical protein